MNENLNYHNGPEYESRRPETDGRTCRVCGALGTERAYSVALCKKCRDKFVMLPLPTWVKVFFASVVLLFLFSLASFPANIKLGIAFERAHRAEQQQNFMQALKHYQYAETVVPNSTEVLVKLSSAYYYNHLIEKSVECLNKLVGRNLPSHFYEEVDGIADNISINYWPDDETLTLINEIETATPEIQIAKIQEYLKDHESTYAQHRLVYYYMELKRYDEAEKLALQIHRENPGIPLNFITIARVYTGKKDYEKAKDYCEMALQINREDWLAYTTAAYNELKHYNDDAGLQLAERAYEIHPEDSMTLTVLSLAYHYKNDIAKRDELFAKVQEKGIQYDIDFLTENFTGKKLWRE